MVKKYDDSVLHSLVASNICIVLILSTRGSANKYFSVVSWCRFYEKKNVYLEELHQIYISYSFSDGCYWIVSKQGEAPNIGVFSLLFVNFGSIIDWSTTLQVAGSISDEVIACLNWPTPSSRTTVLGKTQPLTKMSTRNLPGGTGRPAGA
jgi:hypothetical protein